MKNPEKIKKVVIGLLSLTGLGFMTYLTVLKFINSKSFCDLSEGVSCDVVTSSIYSEIFGVPVSIMGMAYFVFVLYLLFKGDQKSLFKNLFFITLFVLIPSLYLTFTELVFIKSICILCETSKAFMWVILFLSFSEARRYVTLSAMAPIVIGGVVVSLVTFFAQTGTVDKRDYSAFATCLTNNGVTYYKSVRCSNCRRQEKMFGKAKEKLKQVECHPEGENPQVELCLSKKIDKTATFILDKDGVEVNRLVGLQSFKALAEFASCPLDAK